MIDYTQESTQDLKTRIKVVEKGARNCEKVGMKSTAQSMRAQVAVMKAELARRSSTQS